MQPASTFLMIKLSNSQADKTAVSNVNFNVFYGLPHAFDGKLSRCPVTIKSYHLKKGFVYPSHSICATISINNNTS